MTELVTFLPMKMEQTECSETSEYKIQTPGNYTKENIQHTEQGESLKSRIPPNSFGFPDNETKWIESLRNINIRIYFLIC
jgi:hypothetical protein